MEFTGAGWEARGGRGGGDKLISPYNCRKKKFLKLSRSIYQNETSLSSGS